MMKKVLIPLLAFCVALPAFAETLIPVGRATSKAEGNAISIFVLKETIQARPDGLRQFIEASHYDKPRPVPGDAKKQYSWLLEPIVVNCKDNSSANPFAVLLDDQRKEVARFKTGETKLAPPPANEKDERLAGIKAACALPNPPQAKADAAPAVKK